MMGELRWVKLTIDMFSNRKIKYIRKLPDGDRLALVWIALLTMAGRCNAGGMIFLTENIPYTPEMLADELDFDVNTIRLALEAFSKLEMICTGENGFAIANWEEYQNIDGMEKIREQNRIRKQNQRARLKAAQEECHGTSHGTSQQCHATDKEEDIEEDIELSSKEESKANRKRFIPPTLEEVQEYVSSRGNKISADTFINYYSSNGWMVGRNKMKDWKAAVRSWESKERKPAEPEPHRQKTEEELDAWLRSQGL